MGLLGRAVASANGDRQSKKRLATPTEQSVSRPSKLRRQGRASGPVGCQGSWAQQSYGQEVFAPGPNTLQDLFQWPLKVCGRLRQAPHMAFGFSSVLAKGIVIYSDHSGCGSGEEGMRDAILASQLAGPSWSPVIHSVADPAAESREVLSETSSAMFHFNKVESQVPSPAFSMLADVLPHADDSDEVRAAKKQQLHDELTKRPAMYFPPNRTSWCSKTQQQQPVRAVLDDAGEALHVLISGTECQEWSAMNRQARKDNGKSFATFLFWVHQVRTELYDVVFHENVLRFATDVLEQYLGDLQRGQMCSGYELISFVVSPNDIGWPIRRPRRLSALVLRSKWLCSATPEEFAENFCASCRMLGSDLFAYGSVDDDVVQGHYKRELFRKKSEHMRDGATEIHGNQAEGQPVEDFILDATQNLDWTSEHFIMQGVPILADLEMETSRLPGRSWSAYVAKHSTDGNAAQKFRGLAGNGMHRAVIGTWTAYILSCLRSRLSDQSWEIRLAAARNQDDCGGAMSDEEKEMAEMELALSEAPSLPGGGVFGTLAPKAKAAAKKRAPKKKSADGSGSGKPSGRATYTGQVCSLCEEQPALAKNPYCASCKSDVDAAKKDAQSNGWMPTFEARKADPQVFRRFMLDYQAQCPSQGMGRKRATYSKARLQQVRSKEAIVDEGSRLTKMDFFQYEAHYKKKSMSAAAIAAKWKQHIATEGCIDQLGENSEYPQRVLVKTEDYMDVKQRKRKADEIIRETGNDKALLDDGNAAEVLNSFTPNFEEDMFLENPAAAAVVKDVAAGAAASHSGRGKRRTSGASTGSGLPADDEQPQPSGASDITVSRLRAFESCDGNMSKTLEAFSAARAKMVKEVTDITDVRGLIPEYKKVVQERLELCGLVLDDLEALESQEVRQQKLKEALEKLPTTPFPSPELLLTKTELRRRIDALRGVTSQEVLTAEHEAVTGALACWGLLQNSAKNAMAEVQKAVKEEEKKVKEELAAAQKAGAQNPFWQKICKDGPENFAIHPTKVEEMKNFSCFDAPKLFRSAGDVAKLAQDDSFAQKTNLFVSQYATSQPVRSLGRTFLRAGQGTKLHEWYTELVKASKPVVLDEEAAKAFKLLYVGIGPQNMSFTITDSGIIRHGLQGCVFMAMMPMTSFVNAMRDLSGIADEIDVMEKRAMGLADSAVERLKGLQFCKVQKDDLLYIPPCMCVWEKTEEQASFMQFKWVPAADMEFRKEIKFALGIKGWERCKVLDKHESRLRRLLELSGESV
ncbi:unnamed protein product [Symbiodinium microadriaticum]|nr:unnamed protein product [Symbiodinium microadriaticum]